MQCNHKFSGTTSSLVSLLKVGESSRSLFPTSITFCHSYFLLFHLFDQSPQLLLSFQSLTGLQLLHSKPTSHWTWNNGTTYSLRTISTWKSWLQLLSCSWNCLHFASTCLGLKYSCHKLRVVVTRFFPSLSKRGLRSYTDKLWHPKRSPQRPPPQYCGPQLLLPSICHFSTICWPR